MKWLLFIVCTFVFGHDTYACGGKRTEANVDFWICDSDKTMVILNGTNAWCGFYGGVVRAAIEKGYSVACSRSKNTGSGSDGEHALAVAVKHGAGTGYILSTGHSQGGSGAMALAYRLEQKGFNVETLAIQPAWGMGYRGPWRVDFPKVDGYKVIVYGTRDWIVPRRNVEAGYLLLSDPKEIVGIRAGHLSAQKHWARLLDLFD